MRQFSKGDRQPSAATLVQPCGDTQSAFKGKPARLTGTMMDPLLLLPDFLLILGGFCLCRYTAFGRPTWDVVERLVYHLLFPALLFASIVRSPLAPATGSKADFAGRIIIAPPSAGGSTWMRRFGEFSDAFASGWMRLRGNRRRGNYDRGFIVSDHADWPDLLRTVSDTGASRVIATHGNTDALVRLLNERGIRTDIFRTDFGGEED